MPGVMVLDGSNLNLPGRREPHPYGGAALAGIRARCHRVGATPGPEVDFRQSDHEGVPIDAVIRGAGAHGYVLAPIHLAHPLKREN
ncbi:type II 3-dehydroquinate dehydratase [Streptosporangium sp. NPDC002524]|uniref:type II 3-dehydroquinate dehydratase n=1 Tax=Streptosporangium sp. NPDC002524 TaxID=3154537 RepID=UPI00331A0004